MFVDELITLLQQFDRLEVVITTPDGELIDISDIEQEGGFIIIETDVP